MKVACTSLSVLSKWEFIAVYLGGFKFCANKPYLNAGILCNAK
jgi:hypothetical protein